jgi:sec-independent protein translocase protein TatA
LEIGVVLLIVLLIVGPKKLPGLGRNLGTGMREFKDSITSRGGDDSEDQPAKIDATAADSTPAAEPTPAAELPRLTPPLLASTERAVGEVLQLDRAGPQPQLDLPPL